MRLCHLYIKCFHSEECCFKIQNKFQVLKERFNCSIIILYHNNNFTNIGSQNVCLTNCELITNYLPNTMAQARLSDLGVR